MSESEDLIFEIEDVTNEPVDNSIKNGKTKKSSKKSSKSTTKKESKKKVVENKVDPKGKMSDENKKIIIDVVLKTNNIDIEAAKQNYINMLNSVINGLNDLHRDQYVSDEKYLYAIRKVCTDRKLKTFSNENLFDFNSALENLQNQNILVTKKELSKYIPFRNLK